MLFIANYTMHLYIIQYYFVNCDRIMQGRRSHLKSEGAQGGGVLFFRATFYCFFGRFGKMIYLVNLKKWGGSSPLCPPLYAAPVLMYKMGHKPFFFSYCWQKEKWKKKLSNQSAVFVVKRIKSYSHLCFYYNNILQQILCSLGSKRTVFL